jgi:hypothetical protein
MDAGNRLVRLLQVGVQRRASSLIVMYVAILDVAAAFTRS